MIPIKELRVAGDNLGREGMSLMAQEFIAEYVRDGCTYKGAMALAGKLSLLAKCATCDQYWHEQVDKGIYAAEFEISKHL